MAIRILLADDHAVFVDGLRALLATSAEFEVVAAVNDGASAVGLARQLQPDIALMDIGMPRLNGIEATRQIQLEAPGVRVLILSMHDSSEHVFRALNAGAVGYILKEAAAREVVHAIRAAVSGRRYVSLQIPNLDVIEARLKAGVSSPVESLSVRERQVIQLVAEGRSSAEIGEILHVSPKTVDTYRSRTMRKLGLSDTASLVKFAVAHGLTAP